MCSGVLTSQVFAHKKTIPKDGSKLVGAERVSSITAKPLLVPSRSFAKAHRRASARLSLGVELPSSGVLTSQGLSTKKPSRRMAFDWWALRGSNSRPSRCKRDALPAELSAHLTYGEPYTTLILINQEKN